MYIRGMSAEQIARWCRVREERVRRYLRAQEHVDPSIFVCRLINHDRPAPGQAAPAPKHADWNTRYKQLKQFLRRRRRDPRQLSTDEEERRLYAWLHNQRYKHKLGRLNPEREQQLDTLGTWHGDRRPGSNEELWDAMLIRLTSFVDTENRMPIYNMKRTQNERQLAIWIQTQKSRERRKVLFDHRREALDKSLPTWRGNTTTERDVTEPEGPR